MIEKFNGNTTDLVYLHHIYDYKDNYCDIRTNTNIQNLILSIDGMGYYRIVNEITNMTHLLKVLFPEGEIPEISLHMKKDDFFNVKEYAYDLYTAKSEWENNKIFVREVSTLKIKFNGVIYPINCKFLATDFLKYKGELQC